MEGLTLALSRRERGTIGSPRLPREGPGVRVLCCGPIPRRFPSSRSPRSIPRLPRSAPRNLLVYDPTGTAAAYSHRPRHHLHRAENLDNLPNEARLLVIGKDALTSAESVNGRLAAWASVGRTVVVLEQAHPLKSPALPAEMAPPQMRAASPLRRTWGIPPSAGWHRRTSSPGRPTRLSFATPTPSPRGERRA